MSSFMEPLGRCASPTELFQLLALLPSPETQGAGPVTAMNSEIDGVNDERTLLERAGLAAGDAGAWLAALPELRNDFSSDGRACSSFWDLSQRLRTQLPKRTAREPSHAAASEFILRKERE